MEVTSLIVVFVIGLSAVLAVAAVVSLLTSGVDRRGGAPGPVADGGFVAADADAEDLAQLLAVTNERRLARGLSERTAGDVQRQLLEESRR